jgi:peptide/nickel transport system ATP-binding protein
MSQCIERPRLDLINPAGTRKSACWLTAGESVQ